MDKFQLPPAKNELALPSGRGMAYRGRHEFESYGLEQLDESESGRLLEYSRILWRHKIALILTMFLGTMAGVLLTMRQSWVYRARASIEILNINENFLNIQQLTPVSEGNPFTDSTINLQTQIRLLQSETLIKQVLDRLRSRIPEDLKVRDGRFAAWRKALHLPERLPAGEINLPLIVDNLTVSSIRQTRVVEVAYDSADPVFAADFVNTLALGFIESNTEARGKMSEQTGELLARQLDDMRVKLQRSEDALQSYARQTGLIFSADKTDISEERLRQVQEELSKAQADRVTAQSRWEMTKISPPDALSDVLHDTSLRALEEKLTELRRERAELITVYTDQHSRVKRVEAQIAPLEAALQQQRSAVIDRIRGDYEAASRRENLLAAAYDTQARLVSEQGGKSIQYNILKREVDSNRQLYETTLQRVKESSIAAAMRASNVRIVDGAEIPKLPYKPSLPQNATLGLLSGLMLGVGFVIMREWGNRTFQAPGEAQYWLNVPELAVIPSVWTGALKGSNAGRKPNKATNLSLLPLESPKARWPLALTAAHSTLPGVTTPSSASDEDNAFSAELRAWQRKPSLFADSFRSLLASILLSGENGDCPRVLVVTSALPKEGKTTVVCNLGMALAEIRRRVLIVDGDFRQPRMHEIFKLQNDDGLSTLLSDQAQPDETLNHVVKRTGIPGLFMLPSGPAAEGAANLLYYPNLPLLIAILKREFDMVLIDTPPMLGMPDARIVGGIADAVILVTRARHTTRDVAVTVSQRLAEDGIRVLGTILNDCDEKKARAQTYGQSILS